MNGERKEEEQERRCVMYLYLAFHKECKNYLVQKWISKQKIIFINNKITFEYNLEQNWDLIY